MAEIELMPGDEWAWQLACLAASEAHQLLCHTAERAEGGSNGSQGIMHIPGQ